MTDFYSEDYQKNARKSQWYDDVTRNLTKCPFCDLKEKYIISDTGGMILTVNLFPYIDGHLMIIPRRHVEEFAGLSEAEWLAARGLIETGVKLINTELDVHNTNVLYREGLSSGMSLKHLHIHIFPITPEFMKYEKQKFTWQFQDVQFSPLEMAERLRARLKDL